MPFVITLDGPAGAGKSSVAKRLAKRLGVRYLDTGAIYRAIAYHMDKKGIGPKSENELSDEIATLKVRLDEAGVFVNDENVAAEIRTPKVDRIVSAYSALKVVRSALLMLQREQAQYGSLVVEGRDVGSVVFPHADLKFFITASPETRAERRYKDLLRKGEAVTFKEVLDQMRERDRLDSQRELSPLCEPEDSIRIDTSAMGEEEVVNQLVFIVQRQLADK